MSDETTRATAPETACDRPTAPRERSPSAPFGSLAPTLSRAFEFPGRVADARRLARSLRDMRDRVRLELARVECDASTSRRLGRDFDAKRAERAGERLREELADAEAMLGELEAVARRLRRERRVLSRRLGSFAAAVARLPAGRERARMAALLAEAGACLEVSCDVTAPASRAATAALYTFTRGETKHSGQAR